MQSFVLFAVLQPDLSSAPPTNTPLMYGNDPLSAPTTVVYLALMNTETVVARSIALRACKCPSGDVGE